MYITTQMLVTLIITAVNLVVVCTKYNMKDLQSTTFKYYGRKNTTIMENEIKTIQGISKYICLVKCRKHPPCLAFSYADSSSLCKMYEHDSESADMSLIFAAGVWFYDVHNNTENFIQRNVDSCVQGHCCFNSGSCRNDSSTSGYFCTCTDNYHRQFCQGPTSIPLLASCDALKKAGYGFSGTYRIDPHGDGNGLEPFSVVCDMTSDLTVGYTTIHHDKEEDGDVNNVEGKGAFIVNVNYELGRKQIEAIKAVSSSCRQFIKYACIGSLFDGGYQYWISFDGKEMYNWGGVPTGTKGCACGVTKTCDDTSKLCNCDINKIDFPRLDQGYLTDKATLPVTQLRFGDTGKVGEKGVYTLGPLQCA